MGDYCLDVYARYYRHTCVLAFRPRRNVAAVVVNRTQYTMFIVVKLSNLCNLSVCQRSVQNDMQAGKPVYLCSCYCSAETYSSIGKCVSELIKAGLQVKAVGKLFGELWKVFAARVSLASTCAD